MELYTIHLTLIVVVLAVYTGTLQLQLTLKQDR